MKIWLNFKICTFPSPMFKRETVQKPSTPSCFFRDKLNGVIRASIEEVFFPRQSNQCVPGCVSVTVLHIAIHLHLLCTANI